jgi:hypothetical protein
MDLSTILSEFSKNKEVFKYLLAGISKEEYLWKSSPEKWCLLEILCHLYDEEREDFRARIQHVFTNPELSLPALAPADWVSERKYIQQNFSEMLEKFLKEREKSIHWLQSLSNPPWENTHQHPKLGPVSAILFLNNWLAHDYLHIRQITKLKYDRLKTLSGEDLGYAGNW